MPDLRRTPFHEHHRAAGAKLVDFAGWEMPVQYDGILAEHRRVRESVGLFDVSHMGEVRLRGRRALEAIRHMVSNDVSIADGQAQYACICNERGGIVDDVIVYRVAADDVLVCVNASNREKDFGWLRDHNPFAQDVAVTDESDAWAQVAVQGRNAVATLQPLTAVDLAGIATYRFARGDVAGVDDCILARTGYTGEDGFEVFLPAGGAERMWPAIMESGARFGIGPIGLGARDTLRLEMKYALYGHEIDDDTTPLEAGLGWVTKLDKPAFIGRDALVRQKEAGVPRRLVALEVDERIARPGNAILVDGEPAGRVTSGTRSPSLDRNIALGYVPDRVARPGNAVQIDVRGRLAPARVVKPPFYQRPY